MAIAETRRHRDLLLPPVGGGAGGCREGAAPIRALNVHRSDPAAEHLALGVDSGPELDFRLALDLACAHHIDFAIEPVVQ